MKRTIWIGLCGLLLAGLFTPGLRAQTVSPDTVFLGTDSLRTETLRPDRLVMRATTYGAGFTNLLDTYLSPMTYTGTELRVQRESLRQTRWMDGHVMSQTVFNLSLATTENTAGTGEEWAGTVSWDYTLLYRWQLTDHLQLMAGPQLDVHGGFIYNLRNSNNPAQALADAHLGASGMATYAFRIKGHPFLARYQLDVPLLGVMFSPEYGESYYEIFEQDHSGKNILCVTPFNAPIFRQYVSLDVPLRKWTARLGYRFDVRQSHVNEIKNHQWSHVFMVGFVKKFYLL
jgi:hypothetical protein